MDDDAFNDEVHGYFRGAKRCCQFKPNEEDRVGALVYKFYTKEGVIVYPVLQFTIFDQDPEYYWTAYRTLRTHCPFVHAYSMHIPVDLQSGWRSTGTAPTIHKDFADYDFVRIANYTWYNNENVNTGWRLRIHSIVPGYPPADHVLRCLLQPVEHPWALVVLFSPERRFQQHVNPSAAEVDGGREEKTEAMHQFIMDNTTVDGDAEPILEQPARQLLDQGNMIEAATRAGIQSNTWITGELLLNLGLFVLELGRTTLTTRLGQALIEAVVNAGPAVSISPTGPNPIMVQPLPLESGGFGAIPVMSEQPSLGSAFLPRRIDIQIKAIPNTNREDGGDTRQLAFSEHMTTNLALNESLFDGIQPERLSVSVQQQNPEGNARDGSTLNPNSRQQQATRSISINALAKSGMTTHQVFERQMSNLFQLLRIAFPGAELTAEETNPEWLAVQSAPEDAGASGGTAPGSGITEEGKFL